MKNPRPADEAGRGAVVRLAGTTTALLAHPTTAAPARTAGPSPSAGGFALPAYAAVRMHIRPEGFLVCIARPPLEATPEALSTSAPGQAHVKLTHDAGRAWPDRVGEVFAEEALAAGGAAVLIFATMADALACRWRLEGGPRR